MKVKELTDLKLADLWKEFNRYFKNDWEEQEEALRNLKKSLIESSLEADRHMLAMSNPYERTEQYDF